MTGSGKTVLIMVTVEEAIRAGIPVGDLPNLLLTFPTLSASEFGPWVDPSQCRSRGTTLDEAAEAASAEAAAQLAEWQLGARDVANLRAKMAPGVLTPGTTAGEPLHVLSALEIPSPMWQTDAESARESLGASISLLLRLIGRDPAPVRSRDHVMLSISTTERCRTLGYGW